MRKILLIGVISLTCIAQTRVERRPHQFPAETKPVEKPTKAELKLADDLIQQAHALSGDLSETDRAYVLAKLAELSGKRNPEQSQSWADESFRLSDSIQSAAKGLVQMSAMMAMSQNNLDRALEMLSAMDAPRQRDDGSLTPDLRSGAATMLFARAFAKDGMKSVDQLQATARQMGENGFYPYMAVSQLMHGVGGKDKEKAQQIASEALAYVNRRKRSSLENQQVTLFLVNAREFVPVPMMKEILERVVADAMEAAKHAAQDGSGTQVSATIENDSGAKVQLNSMATLMVFQLMPLIREVDPDWAKKLEEQSDELRKAAAVMQSGQAKFMIGARTGGNSANGPNGNGRDFRDEIQSRQVDDLAASDPKHAMEMANNINDPVLHTAAIARVSAAMDDNEAKQRAVRDAKELLAKTSEPKDKLSIYAGLAAVQASLKDEDGLSATLQQIFVIADDLMRKSIDKDPAAGSWMRPGVDTAASMVRNLAKKQSSLVTTRIDDIRQAPLRVLLLIAAVESLDPEAKTERGPMIQFRFTT